MIDEFLGVVLLQQRYDRLSRGSARNRAYLDSLSDIDFEDEEEQEEEDEHEKWTSSEGDDSSEEAISRRFVALH